MRNKLLKKLIASICIMAMVIPMSSEVFAQITANNVGDVQDFGIVQFHESSYLNKKRTKDYGYKVNERYAYRIYAGENNPNGYVNTVLCLDEKATFPGENSAGKRYTNRGTAEQVLRSISTNKNGTKTQLTDEDCKKIQWLMHNAVLPEDSDELIDAKLAKIFEEPLKDTAGSGNPLTLSYIKEILTEDDLVFALQATIWTITNGHNNPVYKGKTKDASQYNSLNDPVNERGRQGQYINIIMNYYKNHYLGADMFPSVTENLEMPTVIKPDKKLIFTNTEEQPEEGEALGQTSDPYIFVGPFKIEHKQNTADYNIDISFEDGNGNSLSTGQGSVEFYIKKEPRTDAPGVSLTKESLNGETFYIALHKGTKVRKIKFNLTPMNITLGKTTTTVWTNENTDMQPLISAIREEGTKINPVNDEYEFGTNYKRKFDVSLRKEIIQVQRKAKLYGKEVWTEVDIENQERQLPEPKVAKEGALNQFEYAHQKAPVKVEVGDIVIYSIRVYNEGLHPVRIATVIDYLAPNSGLELIKPSENSTKVVIDNLQIEYGAYQISDETPDPSGGTKIIISSPNKNETGIQNTDIIGRFKESDIPDCIEIILAFKVKEEADGVGEITNIAEVVEFYGQEDIDEDGNGKGPFLATEGGKIEDIDSKPHNLKLPETLDAWQDYKGRESNPDDLGYDDNYYIGQEDDDDFEKIIVGDIPTIDLALRKSITALNGESIDRQREPDTTPLLSPVEKKTSNFSDIKEPPQQVKVGDKIVYTIRVFNESDSQAGYATQITDYIPKGLGFLPYYNENIANKWTIDENNGGEVKKLSDIPNYDRNFVSSEFNNNSIRDNNYKNQTVICGEAAIKTDKLKDTKLEAFDKSTKKLDIHTVQITCIVLDTDIKEPIRNIAAITEYRAEDNKSKDSDSVHNNDLTNFKEDDHEDDEDYEKIILLKETTPPEKPYDLALKKFVSSVTDATNTPKTIPDDQKRNLTIISVEQLKQRTEKGQKVDAKYSFGVDKDQNPVKIEKGDYVTYTIRIYNEGLIDAKVGEIIDTVPTGLTFITTSAINEKYGWKEFNKTTQTGWTSGVATTVLANTTIPAFDARKENQSHYDQNTGTGIDKGVSYAEVKIEFKVNDDAQNSVKIKNIAEITKDDGDDDDSIPDDKDPNEDDEDFDVIITEEEKYLDLALRKFITKIGDDNITDRVPKVDTTDLDSEKSTTAKYKHPKQEDIKTVVTGQEVEYTIRVYNEGNQAGYASEIKDDIPEGLEFLPEHQTNKDNLWKMYDKDGNETEDVKKAVSIRTNAKSKENGQEKNVPENANAYFKSNTNIINAYDKDNMDDGPDYVEVKVVFKVVKKVVTDGNKPIINTAEITEETDEDGNETPDRDSVPDNDKPDEDDIDKEYIQLKYFDLSLLKYVSKVIVTEDGVTKETDTGYDGTENPEPVVKVELNKNKLAQTQVKYVYTIKITNEGEIEGYAKEITDRIPAGLYFDPADNKATGWVQKEEGIITTDHLKDTLLKPGESATVQVVLRWQNSETNLGQKVNVAEISIDENEYDIPDIDSTPGNNVDGEDDQDNAIVVLSIKTGSSPLYITLITLVTAIMGTGLYLIYKYVVKK